MSERKAKVPPTLEEQRDKLERKVRRLEGQIMRLEVSATVDAQQRVKERKEQEEEMWKYRRFILEQLRHPLSHVIHSFTTDQRHLAHYREYPRSTVADTSAEHDLIDCLVEAAEPFAFRDYQNNLRAPCPLCGSEPNGPYATGGYALPVGLERHLTGWGNARQCFVMQVIREETRQDARETLADPHRMEMRAARQSSSEAAPEAPTPIFKGVRPCAAQRDLPEEQVSVWEINSDSEESGGPYTMRVPERTKWVRGTKVQAGYVRERWLVALQWHALPKGTRFWAALSRDSGVLWMAPVLNRADEEEPATPTWDREARVWRGPEPVIVDSVEGLFSFECERGSGGSVGGEHEQGRGRR